MVIFITGGTGVIGSHLIKKLLEENHFVYAVARDKSKLNYQFFNSSNFYLIENDFTKSDFTKLTISWNVQCMIHLAGVVTNSSSSLDEYSLVNLEGTNNVIQFCLLNKIPKIIFSSSVSVYGHHIPFKELVETDLLLGISDYAKSKIEAEKIIINSGIQYNIFRISSVYGQNTKGYIQKLFSLFKKRIFPFPNHGIDKKSFIHIEDVSGFIINSIEYKKSGIFNISEMKPISLQEIYNLFKSSKINKLVLKIPIYSISLKIIDLINKLLYILKLSKSKKKINLSPLLEPIVVSPNLATKELYYNCKHEIKNDIFTQMH